MDVIQAIRDRRSINFFEPGRDISAQTMRDLLELANLAPSSMNLQPWRVIVVNDPERKKALRQCAFDQPKVEEASAVLIMIADPRAVEENIDQVLESWVRLGYIKPEAVDMYRGLAGKLYGTGDSLTRNFFAVKNTSLYAMNVMIAAKGLGLETHPMDGFDEGAVEKAFSIPGDKIVPMLLAIGYLKSGFTPLPRAYRRNFEDFVTMNSYR